MKSYDHLNLLCVSICDAPESDNRLKSRVVLVGKHVGLGSSVCVVGAVRALNTRVAVSGTREVKGGGVWELSNKWCCHTHSLPPLLCSHMCLLAGC